MRIVLRCLALLLFLSAALALILPIQRAPESHYQGALKETDEILGRWSNPSDGLASPTNIVTIKLGTLLDLRRRAEAPDLHQNLAYFLERLSIVLALLLGVCLLILGRRSKNPESDPLRAQR
jgi:hypothetical protein